MGAVLLVLDMQEQLHKLACTIVIEINRTIQHCREKKIPIIFTRHGHKNLDIDGGVLAQFWGRERAIQYEGTGWDLVSEMETKRTDIIIDKTRYDAFHGTNLLDTLRALKVETVVIAGLLSNLSCESTARAAFSHDFQVFLSDVTGALASDHHAATLMNIEFGFGRLCTAAEFRKSFP